MKALVVAPQPFFSPRGTPFSVYYRTLVSSELGIKIDFLTYGEGQDVDIPNVNIIRIPRFKFLGTVKIGPSPLKLFLIPPILSTKKEKSISGIRKILCRKQILL